ncbi:acetylglutamate kinase [Virgibacillus halodenitrificans]|uniref:acetylglutamate kinase n=1 Tax=Virgibacillus halodenitrificans TaxID=1482 RepID=UPI001EEE4745|nr:acetylglutamate kinase [Virgibacillus halodenitrificans]MCG1029730.1 acetylglutamate kinase [Virgibacillus halodenitrificans]
MHPIGREVRELSNIVFKLGGSIIAELPNSFYDMLVHLKRSAKCNPIIVHGGGPAINKLLDHLKIEHEFVKGLRKTSKDVLEIAEMVMSGSINKHIVTSIQTIDGKAIGLSGVDAAILQAKPLGIQEEIGYVGEVENVDTEWLHLIIQHGAIPVISPIGLGSDGQHYNINGDMAAAAVAETMNAKLAFISDIPGVKEERAGRTIIHPSLTKEQTETMIKTGIIHGGMIPKVQSAIKALTGGVTETVILNGWESKDIEAYLDGKQAGTKLIIEKEANHV